MKLYIANGTRQTHNFQYRTPGVPGLRSQYIPAGKQLLLSGDMSLLDIQYIIEKNLKYGLVDCTKIDQSKPYVGLVYSIDKPVPVPKIQNVMEHNIDVLTERGHQNREMAAITANQALETQLEQNQVGQLQAMDVEIIEENKPGQDTGRTRISEGFRVTRHETTQARQTGKAPGKVGKKGRKGK